MKKLSASALLKALAMNASNAADATFVAALVFSDGSTAELYALPEGSALIVMSSTGKVEQYPTVETAIAALAAI